MFNNINNMIINALLLLFTIIGIYFFVQRLGMQDKKDVVAEASYENGQIAFHIDKVGKYNIWDKRIKRWSFLHRGINNYHFRLYHIATDSEIPLNKEDDPHFSTVKTRNTAGNENQWKVLYSFQVSAGDYVLKYDALDIAEFPELAAFKNLGFFNVFKPIKPDKYNVVITQAIDDNEEFANIAYIILSFMAATSSLAYLLIRLIQK